MLMLGERETCKLLGFAFECEMLRREWTFLAEWLGLGTRMMHVWIEFKALRLVAHALEGEISCLFDGIV